MIEYTMSANKQKTTFQVFAPLTLLLCLAPLFCSFWPFTNGESTTLVCLNTTETTNHGAPFYVYIKEVDKGAFIKETYQSIVNEAFPSTGEQPPSQPHVVFPGKNYEIEVPRMQKEKMLAVYVLYTNPGDDWKFLTNGSNKVTLTLGDSEILRAYIK